MQQQEQTQTIHLSDYYQVLLKHKGVIFAALVVTVTLTVLFTFLMQPVYRASSVMVIDSEQNVSPLTGERMGYESYVSQALTFKTHFKLVKSRPVLELVVRNLHLDRVEENRGLEAGPLAEMIAGFKENIRLLLNREEVILTPQERLEKLIEKLGKKISIEEVRDTRLLRINVEDSDPVLARDIANELTRVYIRFNMSNRVKSSQNTLDWMKGELYEMKKNLEDAEAAFMAYKQDAQIYSVTGKQKVISQKIEEFNDAYLKARNRRLELDAKLSMLAKTMSANGDIRHARSLIDNPLISNLHAQLLNDEVELTRLSKVFKSKHPKIIQVKSKIRKTRNSLNDLLSKELESLKAERDVLFNREKVLEKTIAGFENDALDTHKKALKYNILERNMETSKQLYDTLLAKLKETNIEGKLDVSNIRVVESASIPPDPVKPKKKLNVILSIVFGIMTGVGLAFFLEYMDRSIRTEEDVQRYLGLPVLSVVPVADRSKLKETGK